MLCQISLFLLRSLSEKWSWISPNPRVVHSNTTLSISLAHIYVSIVQSINTPLFILSLLESVFQVAILLETKIVPKAHSTCLWVSEKCVCTQVLPPPLCTDIMLSKPLNNISTTLHVSWYMVTSSRLCLNFKVVWKTIEMVNDLAFHIIGGNCYVMMDTHYYNILQAHVKISSKWVGSSSVCEVISIYPSGTDILLMYPKSQGILLATRRIHF